MSSNFDLYSPIPPVKGTDDGVWRQVPIIQGSHFHEPLVPLGMFAGPEHNKIFTDSMYFAERKTSPYTSGEIDGALITCFVRKSVAEALVFANHLLPKGHALIVWDAYRPEKVQRALYEDFHKQLVAQGYEPDAATVKAQEYVSIPSLDPLHPSPHITGGSVDVGIIKFEEADWKAMQAAWKLWSGIRNDQGESCVAELMQQKFFCERSQLLDMGAGFDQVSERTALRYYEEKFERGEKLSQKDEERMNNRRMLSNVMLAAGFADYPHEWWHKDWGNQFYGHQSGTYAVYGVANFSDDNMQFENEHRQDYRFLADSIAEAGSRLVMPLRIVTETRKIPREAFRPDNAGVHPSGFRLDAAELAA